MLLRRYSIVVADRETGVIHRFTFRVRPLILAMVGMFALPVAIGYGLRLGAASEVHHLRAANSSLEQENASYREATGALTTQIESLQASINDLGVRARMDPAAARAMDKLPAPIRSQGGTSMEGASALLTPEITKESSPERVFGMLQNV